VGGAAARADSLDTRSQGSFGRRVSSGCRRGPACVCRSEAGGTSEPGHWLCLSSQERTAGFKVSQYIVVSRAVSLYIATFFS